MSDPKKIVPIPREPLPVCSPDCPSLRHDDARDRDWCALTDDWLPSEDVACIPWVINEFQSLRAELDEANDTVEKMVSRELNLRAELGSRDARIEKLEKALKYIRDTSLDAWYPAQNALEADDG